MEANDIIAYWWHEEAGAATYDELVTPTADSTIVTADDETLTADTE